MYKIPDSTKKYYQLNKSDLLGNIHYSKNLNFDEEGYIKLSPRTICLLNEKDDSNLGLPLSFGRYTSDGFFLATTDKNYILEVADNTTEIITEDDDDDGETPPGMDFFSDGCWFDKKWVVATSTNKIFSKSASTGNWTEELTGLTDNVTHCLCPFEKQGEGVLLIGNGNGIKAVWTDYNETTTIDGASVTLAQLNISSDYEIVDIAYNNNLVGIATRLASTVEGENKEAGFFIWDGSESSANYLFKVGSDACLSVHAYKSSFIVTTRAGNILYYNGGGLEELVSFPTYYKDVIWGNFLNKLVYGKNIIIDGDIIYFNINPEIVDKDLNDFTKEMIAGLWVYDPKVGLYHRNAPSITQAHSFIVDETTIANDTFTVSSYASGSLVPETGNPVKIINTTTTELKEGKIYWIIKSSPTTFKLASTKANALAMIPISMTAGSSFSGLYTALNLTDYSQSRAHRAGGVALYGNKAYLHDDIIFGSEVYNIDSTLDFNVNSTINTFRNIGYLVTSKIESSNIEDVWESIIQKYRPLGTDDSIILKIKTEDLYYLPQLASCTITSSNTLTTTEDLSNIMTITDLELEVISGAGGGQMSQITSITENSGTYTITLDDELDGFSNGNECNVIIENWKYVGRITSDDKDYKYFGTYENGKSIQLKCILDGYDIAIEESQFINKTHLPSK